MKSVLLLIAVVCSVSGLPALYDDERIIGGDLAKPGNFSYVVSITENDRHFCGGFIYSNRWIVTAASCVVGKTASKLKVIAGQVSAITSDPNEQTLAVYTITPVPQYNSTLKTYDIALLRLSTDIVFDYKYVDFVSYNELDDSLPGIVMGWGATFDGGLESVNLHFGEVSVIPMTRDTTCGKYKYPEFDFATMICVSNNDTATATPTTATPGAPVSGEVEVHDDALPGSPCQYDEGSPLVQVNEDGVPVAVGILSKINGCSADSYSVYTRVSIFYSWLTNTAGQQPTRPTPTTTTEATSG